MNAKIKAQIIKSARQAARRHAESIEAGSTNDVDADLMRRHQHAVTIGGKDGGSLFNATFSEEFAS